MMGDTWLIQHIFSLIEEKLCSVIANEFLHFFLKFGGPDPTTSRTYVRLHYSEELILEGEEMEMY